MADGIVHIEIPVKDLEETPNFYSGIAVAVGACPDAVTE